MVTGYILVKVSSDADKNIWNKFSHLPNILEASWIYGEFDMILKVEAQSLDLLDDFVFDELRKIDGIKSTTTLLVSKKMK